MLWCIPSLSRLGSKGKSSDAPTTHRKPISGPVELDDHKRRKQFQRQNPDAASNETGVYYLIANQNGPGKSIVRRNPVPPPPPAPMDDSIDDMTQAPTTVAQKADTDWAGRTRGSPMTGASSVPMDDNFDAATYTAPGVESNKEPPWQPLSNRVRDRVTLSSPRVPQTGGDWYTQPKTNHAVNNRPWHGEQFKLNTPAPSSPRDRHGTTRQSPATNSSPGSGCKTVAVPEPIENYGDYGLYMREMERVFGGQGELQGNLERKKPQLDQVEQHELGRVKSREVNRGSPFARSPEPGHTVTYNTRFETALPRGYNYGNGNKGRKKGPRAGQDYEVVERKVLEDTPEKTVTIATWRERVAMEADPNAVDTSSVHYMSPEDYATAERTTTDDSNLQSTQITTQETQQSGGSIRSDQLPTLHQHPVITGSGSMESPAMPGRQLPPTPPHKFIGNVHQPQTRSASSQSHHRSTPPPRIATPERIPPSKHHSRSPRTTRGSVPAYSTPRLPPPPPPPPEIIPRSSSARHSSPSPTYNFNIQPGSPDIYEDGNLPIPRQSPLQESTPIRQSMSPIPFHPRQSHGSTISSIKSESVVHFEHILDSCEPSLLHIAPILASLGITKEAHLKAVTRLSEEMRDREVREEALRLGVTFVEWAILLDKVSEL